MAKAESGGRSCPPPHLERDWKPDSATPADARRRVLARDDHARALQRGVAQPPVGRSHENAVTQVQPVIPVVADDDVKTCRSHELIVLGVHGKKMGIPALDGIEL